MRTAEGMRGREAAADGARRSAARQPPSLALEAILSRLAAQGIGGAAAMLGHVRDPRVAEVALDSDSWLCRPMDPSEDVACMDAADDDRELVAPLLEALEAIGVVRRRTWSPPSGGQRPCWVASLRNHDTMHFSDGSLRWKAWRHAPPTLGALRAMGSMCGRTEALLLDAVADARTIAVAGPTGTGKTVLLNALARCAVAHRPRQRLYVDEEGCEVYLPPDALVERSTVGELSRLCATNGRLVATRLRDGSLGDALSVAERLGTGGLLEATHAACAESLADRFRASCPPGLNPALELIVMMRLGGPSGMEAGSAWQVGPTWGISPARLPPG